MPYWQTGNYIINDSILELSFDWQGISLDTSRCLLGSAADAGLSFRINTKYGLSSYCSSGWGYSCNSIVGSIINGVKSGITIIPTTINIAEVNNIKVFPNPFNDRLYINYNQSESLNYKIVDLNGNILMQQKLNNNFIITDDLRLGVYSLVIYNKNINITKKIIKINNR